MLFSRSEMGKLDLLVVDLPAEKNEIVMHKSTNKKAQKTQPKINVIKNGHTMAELAESGERWANHSGSYLTLDEVFTIEAAKQKQQEAQ